jgi:hypothetical protein
MCAAAEDKAIHSFCEETGQVFDQFPKYHVNILLGYFNAKSGRKYTCSNWHLGIRADMKIVIILV